MKTHSSAEVVERTDDVWSMDIVGGGMANGRPLKALVVVVEDAVSHKVVGIVLAYRISDLGAARMLDQAARNHGYPQAIRAPCEHVFVSEHFQSWSRTRGIQLVWENAGRTSLKGCIESANRKFWSECLGALSVETLRQARALAACWERGFNGAASPGSVLQ